MIKSSLTLIIILALLSDVSAADCHYSCSTCINSTYTNCLTCTDSHQHFTPIYTSNGAAYGLCSTPAYTTINGFGVFLLITSIGAGLLLRSQHIFYFILTFQTLGLLSLVEVAYTGPLNTILNGFQYFMIFSHMGSNNKQEDGILISRGMYRLDAFLKCVQLDANFTPVFVLVFLVAVLLALLLLFQKYRQRRCKCISNQSLEIMLTALRTIILLTMQEMLLIIYVGIRWDNLSAGDTAMIVLYCLVVIGLLVDLNWHRIPYFRTKKLLNLTIAQKLILPVLVIVPPRDTYQLVIFVIGFAILELFFYAKSSAKTKHFVYSILRMVSSLLIGVFIAVDLAVNNQNSSNTASIFGTIALALFLAAFAVQLALSTKDKCLGAGKVKNDDELLVRANTSEKIAVLREDTLDERTIEGHIKGSGKQSLDVTSKTYKERAAHQQRVSNLLEVPKKQEKRFKTHKI